MASELSARRLRRELMSLKKKPVENIEAVPLESNILEWHYVITGTAGTPYEGGYYYGKLKFPPEYPMKPPSVLMMTPSGRFKTNRRLCLSMSDFHPESWNPMWSVGSILTGLYSFMLDKASTLGSIESTDAQKRKLAAQSLEYNCRDATFRRLFPDLVKLHEERKRRRSMEESQKQQQLNDSSNKSISNDANSSDSNKDNEGVLNNRLRRVRFGEANAGGRGDGEGKNAGNESPGTLSTIVALVVLVLIVALLVLQI